MAQGFGFEVDPGIMGPNFDPSLIPVDPGFNQSPTGDAALIQQLLGGQGQGGFGSALGGGQQDQQQLLQLLSQLQPQALQAGFNTNINPQAALGGVG